MKRTLLAALALAAIAAGQQSISKAWDALSAPGTTSAISVGGNDKHTVAVVTSGSPAACTAILEGSIDGSAYFDLSGDQTCTSSVMFHVADRSVDFVRVRIKALSAGGRAVPTYYGIKSGGRR